MSFPTLYRKDNLLFENWSLDHQNSLVRLLLLKMYTYMLCNLLHTISFILFQKWSKNEQKFYQIFTWFLFIYTKILGLQYQEVFISNFNLSQCRKFKFVCNIVVDVHICITYFITRSSVVWSEQKHTLLFPMSTKTYKMN